MGDGKGQADELVGRVRELEQLDAALSDAIERRGSLVVITGEPGIGKTALARAFVELAGARGASWAWGTCWEGGGAPAYWPWLQIVRQLAQREDAATLRAALGARVSSIAGLMPELAGTLGLPAAPRNLDTEQARFLLFDALASLLAGVSERRPLVIVFDDLHWAEPSTLLALEFVARALPDLPILAIAAYRHAEAHARGELATALGGLARAARRLPLAGLDRDEVGRLAAARARAFAPGESAEIPPSLVAAVHHASAGNPFFVDELVQLLAARGRLHEAADPRVPLPLPEGVRDTIRGRLEPIGEDGLAALRVAAVLGVGFHVRMVAAILGITQDEVLKRLDAALRTGLVSARDTPGHFGFVHSLVRDTLLGDLGAAEQARLHLLAAQGLERLHADDLEPYAVKIAHHYLEGAAEGGATRAVEFAVIAARRAMTQLGYDEAARLYQRAIDVATGLEPDGRLAWRLCHGLGEALVRAGDVDGAYAALGEAIEHARRLGDAEAFAMSVLARALPGYSPAVVEADAVALLEEAIERMDGRLDVEQPPASAAAADALRCRLRVQLALALFWSPDRARREQLVDEALRIARDLAASEEAQSSPVQRALADRTLAFALGQGFLAVWGPDTLERGLPISAEALELCERTGDTELAMQVRMWRISLLLELDDPLRADAEIESYGEIAQDLGQPRLLVYDPLHRAMRAQMRGEFDEAERCIARTLHRAREVRGSIAPIAADAQTFLLRRSRGTHGELEGLLRRNAGRLPAMHDWRAALALVLAETGRAGQARRELDELGRGDFAEIPRGTTWLPTLALLAELCALLGDIPRARMLYELLVPFEGRNAVSIGAAYLGPVARYLGLLATTIGADEWALGHLETARSAAARMGARPTAVLTALDAAEVLTRRDLPGDADRAAALVRSVAREAERLGMAPAVARVAALRASLAPEAPHPQPAALGPCESDARLIREGDVWQLGYGGRTIRLQSVKGLRHLATLLASPQTAITAVALAAPDDGGGAGPSDIDERRARVTELREELAEARAFNDPERIARVSEQLEAVAAEFAPGAAGAPAERARVNVTRAIRSAIRRITEHEPELGRHLRATIRTGMTCTYIPDPESPLRWEIRA